MLKYFSALLGFLIPLLPMAQAALDTGEINQPTIFKLAKLGSTIYEGVFTGNGLLGTMAYAQGDTALRVDIGRTDVYDHRPEADLFGAPRLPIGHLLITFQKPLLQLSGEIHLQEAENKIHILTDQGSLTFTLVTFYEEDYMYIHAAEEDFHGEYTIRWVPEEAKSPRLQFDYAKKPSHYPLNPPIVTHHSKEALIYQQALLAGGGYVTGIRTQKEEHSTAWLITVAYSRENALLMDSVRQQLAAFDFTRLPEKIARHRAWWKAFYQQSSYSMPDRELQEFYQMQRYKIASATGAKKPALDLQGPWTAPTPWPGYWFNLNIQLAYSPLYTANHLDVASSLLAIIDQHTEQLIRNVPEKYQKDAAGIGRNAGANLIAPIQLTTENNGRIENMGDAELSNLTWVLYYYWQHYRYSMDERIFERLYPLLKRSINYALYFIAKNKDTGDYEFQIKTYSPEYPNAYDYNTNYDLSLLKWGLQTLMALADQHKLTDVDYPRWKEIATHLKHFPKDETGFKISDNIAYTESHRHYSHLMMIYPLHLLLADSPENNQLIDRSLAHWQSKNQSLQGYSFTGLASIEAIRGQGNQARDAIKLLLKKYIKPNTLYAESGPVIETPLAAATSLQELALQFWGGTIRVFPAVPSDWESLHFKSFRTDGAFLISGTRENYANKEVKVTAEKGGKLKIKVNLTGESQYLVKGKAQFIAKAGDIYSFETFPGDTINFYQLEK